MSFDWGPGGPERIRPGLERIREAARRTGHPERSFPALHIAGTNGKGSTACFCESILIRLLPDPVGLYTSPHLLSPTERIRVAGTEIPQETFERKMREAKRLSREVAGAVGEPLSWFEAMTWVAFDWFRRRGVGLAVLETGLGGRWDATAICRPVVSVITGIGLEHREWLGATLPEIAAEKAGILREGIPAIFGTVPAAARRVLLRTARDRSSPVWEAGRDLTWKRDASGALDIVLPDGVTVRAAHLGLPGRYQEGNAALACAATWRVARSRGIPAARFRKAAREGLARARLPGRYARLPGTARPSVWVDGGHNPDAAAALARELGTKIPGKPTIALWSMLRDKDARRFVRVLAPSIDGWVPYRMEQERAAPLDALVGVLRTLRVPVRPADRFPEGMRIARAWAGRAGRVLVCGSLMAAADAYRHRAESLP
ncbi:MAG: folylpolyglutamate synthase/dihydrofolate synthase family protein [Deltaproteobacteria bacterium]